MAVPAALPVQLIQQDHYKLFWAFLLLHQLKKELTALILHLQSGLQPELMIILSLRAKRGTKQ